MAEAGNITIRVEGMDEAIAKLQTLAAILPSEIDRVIEDRAEEMFAVSQHLVPVDTGMLQRSGTHTHEFLRSEIGYNTPYACLIGGRQKVMCKNGLLEVKAIQNGKQILSKDGNYHSGHSFVTGTFWQKPVGIILACKKGRGKLLVTADHLIITVQDGLPVFARADSLRIGDAVWHKRKIPHNKGTRKFTNKICPKCTRQFRTSVSRIIYCSSDCYHSMQKGRAMPEYERNKHKGWKKTREQREKIAGSKNPAWKGGTSKLPYGCEWNRILKERVRERDDYVCRICGIPEKTHAHPVHHIDANKFNNKMENLITLCVSCHGKQQHQDCELIDINTSVFELVFITKAERIYANNKKGAAKKTLLWDINVRDENTFYAGGMLIHNSFVHDGTSRMPPRPYLLGAVQIVLPKLVSELEKLGQI